MLQMRLRGSRATKSFVTNQTYNRNFNKNCSPNFNCVTILLLQFWSEQPFASKAITFRYIFKNRKKTLPTGIKQNNNLQSICRWEETAYPFASKYVKLMVPATSGVCYHQTCANRLKKWQFCRDFLTRWFRFHCRLKVFCGHCGSNLHLSRIHVKPRSAFTASCL